MFRPVCSIIREGAYTNFGGISQFCANLLTPNVRFVGLCLIKEKWKVFGQTQHIFWRCVYRASYCNVLMTNEMHNSYNQFLFHSFCLLYMFRTNLVVHHQEHCIIYCITQYNRYNRAIRLLAAWKHDCTDCTKLCNTVYYAELLMMND